MKKLQITNYKLQILIIIFSVFTLSAAVFAGSKEAMTNPPPPAASAQAGGESADVQKTVEEIQKKFAGIKGLGGSFVQKSYIKDIEDTQEYSGTFSVKKPSLMMWEYAAPRDEKVVIRDLDTWIYKKSQNQVIKTRFSKEAYSQVPIALLISLENMSNDFDISAPAENALQLVPKQKIGFIKTIVLETKPGAMPVKMFTIFDTYGNIIMIELSDVKVNPGLDDSFFTFHIPPDAEVYDMSK